MFDVQTFGTFERLTPTTKFKTWAKHLTRPPSVNRLNPLPAKFCNITSLFDALSQMMERTRSSISQSCRDLPTILAR